MRRALAALHRVDLQRVARLVVAPMAAAPGAAPAPPGFARVSALADVPEGLSEAQLRPGVRVVLVRRAGGALHALGGECPHRQGQMAVGDIEEAGGGGGTGGGGAGGTCCIICPRHRKRFEGGLRFDVASGRAFLRAGAAPCDEFDAAWRLPVHDVLTRGGDVFVSEEPRPEGGAAQAGAVSAVAGAGAGAGARAGADAPATAASAAPAAAEPSSTEAAVSEWQLEAVSQAHKDVRMLSLQRRLRPRRDGGDRDSAAPGGVVTSELGPWHVRLSLSSEPGALARDYTPLSSLEDFGEGRVSLLVKSYKNGLLTKPLGELAPGASLFLSPPLRTLESHALQARLGEAAAGGGGGGGARRDALLLVCGGSGVTPVLQMARWALEGRADSAPPAFASVLVLSSMRGEPLCRAELAALARRHAQSVRVLHTLTGTGAPPAERIADEQAPARVDFAVGRISAAHVRQLLGSGAARGSGSTAAGSGGGGGIALRVLVSGPPGFAAHVEQAVREAGAGEAELSAIDFVALES